MDYKSASINVCLTAGNVAEIKGSNLGFDPGNNQHGVYIRNNVTGEQQKVEQFIKATAHSIVFMVPDSLPTDGFTVRVKRGTSNQINNIILDAVLNAA